MAETTDDVRRDIELTRERMSNTLAELERRLNAKELVRQHPWPAIGLAAGAGFLLSGTRADVKAAAATATLAEGATTRVSRVGPALDDLLSKLVTGVQDVVMERADDLIAELRVALGGSAAAPSARHAAAGAAGRSAVFGTAAAGAAPVSGLRGPGDRGDGTPEETTTGTHAGWSASQTGTATSGTSGGAFGGESREVGRAETFAQRPQRAD